MATKERKLDLFKLIRHAEMRDFGYYDTLSEDEQKEFQPWVAMRFMSAAPDNGTEHMSSLLMTDVVLNADFTITSKDKAFFYRLMCIVGDGSPKKHYMIRPPSSKMKPQIINELFAEIIPESMTADEIDTFMRINHITMKDLVELAEDIGWDNDKIKLLKKVGVNDPE